MTTRFGSLLVLALLVSVIACDSTGPSSDQEVHFTSIVAGDGSTCGLTSDGKAFCWGDITGGTPTTNSICGGREGCTYFPDQRFKDLDLAGGIFGDAVCGITYEDETVCWGHLLVGFDFGMLISDIPQPLADDRTLESISVAARHFCGTTTNGEAWCWGDYRAGVRGTGQPLPDQFQPADLQANQVAGGIPFHGIATGLGQTCALDDAGSAWCWGSSLTLGSAAASLDSLEQCGYTVPPFSGPCSHQPVKVAGNHTFAALSSGTSHVCGLDLNHGVYCWGMNEYGQLGTGDTSYSVVPVLAQFPDAVTQVVTGSAFTCVLASFGRAWCWGSIYGVRNDTGGVNSLIPVSMADQKYVSLAAGPYHVCGLTEEGTVDCWGAE